KNHDEILGRIPEEQVREVRCRSNFLSQFVCINQVNAEANAGFILLTWGSRKVLTCWEHEAIMRSLSKYTWAIAVGRTALCVARASIVCNPTNGWGVALVHTR